MSKKKKFAITSELSTDKEVIENIQIDKKTEVLENEEIIENDEILEGLEKEFVNNFILVEKLKNTIITPKDNQKKYVKLDDQLANHSLDRFSYKNVELKNENIKTSCLKRLSIRKSILKDSAFHLCKLNGFIVEDSNITNTKFLNCDLQFALFNNSEITNTIFENVDLTYACFINSSLKNVTFQNCNLLCVDFETMTNLDNVFINNCHADHAKITSSVTFKLTDTNKTKLIDI